MFERAAEPVDLDDHELVAAAVDDQQRLVEFGSADEVAGDLSMKICSPLAAVSASCRALGFWSRVETRP